MGIISLALIFVSIAAVLLYFQTTVERPQKKTVANLFVSLRIALDCRHQAVRHVLDAYSKHLQEQELHRIKTFSRCVAEVETCIGANRQNIFRIQNQTFV